MIGNLFQAVSIALLSGVFAVGGVNADNVKRAYITNGNSWVSGQECTVIQTGHLDFHVPVSSNGCQFEYFSLDDLQTIDSDGSSTGVLTYYDNLKVLYDVIEEVSFTENVFYYGFQSLDNPIVLNGQRYAVAVRFGFSYPSNVNGFEIHFDVPVLLCKYDLGNYTGVFNPVYQTTTTKNTSLGVYSYDTASVNDDYTMGGTGLLPASTYSYVPFELTEYLFIFADNSESSHDAYVFHLDWQAINGNSIDYIVGYNDGYTTGYYNGNHYGYEKGYEDGLSMGTRGEFGKLFNAIADTPLRFLYGLFNFDLFGTSVLVIVLTLLTGIVVFSIVKKVWK